MCSLGRRRRKVAVLGIPSALGQPHLGVGLAPNALREAGLLDYLRLAGFTVEDHGDLSVPQLEESFGKQNTELKNLPQILAASRKIYKNVKEIGDSNKTIPLILGGDHSLSIGSIAAFAAKNKNLGVLWFDAHPDLNTPETSPSGNAHGMSLATVLGLGHPKLTEVGLSKQKIKPEQVVIIGARSIDQGEECLIAQEGIKVFSMADINKLGITTVVQESIRYLSQRTSGIHLSFDLDVLDPVIAPGVGTPVPGGLSFAEARLAMEVLRQGDLITSAEVVELNPTFDLGDRTAKQAVALVAALLGKMEEEVLRA